MDVSDLEPYSSRLSGIYVLLMGDALLNALEHTNVTPSTQLGTVSLLTVQVVLRLLVLLMMCALVASTNRWEASIMDFLVTFKGVFSTHLFALLCCFLLRVYRVMLASYPEEFTVSSQWEQPVHMVLVVVHLLASLLFYYTNLSAVLDLGDVMRSSPAASSRSRPTS